MHSQTNFNPSICNRIDFKEIKSQNEFNSVRKNFRESSLCIKSLELILIKTNLRLMYGDKDPNLAGGIIGNILIPKIIPIRSYI